MNKKMVKIFSAILMIIMLVSVSISSFAALKPGDINIIDPNSTNTIKGIGGSVLGIIQTVGVILAVVILMILGIKYMMGSAEAKAEYQKTMIPYIVGAVLLFGASAFANVIYDLASGITI